MDAVTMGRASISVPYISDEEIQMAASRLRTEYVQAGGPSTAALHPDELVWDLLDSRDRLSLNTEEDLGKTSEGIQIVGSMAVLNDGGMIRIDKAVVPSPLYPFTLAHEIGHWILHKNYINEAILQGNLFEEIPREWFTLHRNLQGTGERVPREEWQANRFATHLLMPSELVIQEYRARFGDKPFLASQPRARRDCARHLASEPKPGMASLFTEFEVSKESMAIRLEELGLIRDHDMEGGFDF